MTSPSRTWFSYLFETACFWVQPWRVLTPLATIHIIPKPGPTIDDDATEADVDIVAIKAKIRTNLSDSMNWTKNNCCVVDTHCPKRRFRATSRCSRTECGRPPGLAQLRRCVHSQSRMESERMPKTESNYFCERKNVFSYLCEWFSVFEGN